MYPRDTPEPVSPTPDFAQIETEILDRWEKHDTFGQSIAARNGCAEWVFYDGPPFANGMPHYGHLLTGYAKDVFPRFQTMRGKQVHRRFGWDTHGLPAELEAERQLGITDKSQIEAMGIASFNQAAREGVLRYADQWRSYVTRQARWVDFDNGYKTLDSGFMESTIWAFKQLYDKGLAYEGYRVLPYCWRDQTPLSNHELRMDDDVYKVVQDQSVTVSFVLGGPTAQALSLSGVHALAWTTTPWTLPTNAALAVGPDIRYVVVAAGPHVAESYLGSEFLIAEDLLANYVKDLGYPSIDEARAKIRTTISGRELDGVEYERLFDYYADLDRWGMHNAWRVLVADYVTTTDGTGIVHLAPAYGEEDQKVCQAADIPTIVSLDAGGRFTAEVADVTGQLWAEANKALISLIRRKGRLLRQASYEHSYPHCWRCRQPLIYRAVSSWFIAVTAIRDRMIELNQDIEWVPENVKDGQFGKWLEGARDWSISRNRYWGSPIPVWKSDNPAYPRIDVYGSFAQLEADFGRLPRGEDGQPDLHRPYIDELTRPNPDDPSGQSTMRRIPDVLDVWFDSGSMPFAQVHYPFENRQWFDTHHPADFIVEYIGQTRGWFYTMHVLSTALFDRPAYRRVVSHGIVLGSDGQKMSKSLRNYPDVAEVFDRDGSDAMRWFLMASSVLRGGNLVVTEAAIRESVRRFLLPVWSSWYFFSLYANASSYSARSQTSSTHVLDRYLLAKTHDAIISVTAALDALDSTTAASELEAFADTLTNWFIRRSRDRFWNGFDGSEQSGAAFDTLAIVLEALTRLAAPLAPLVMEKIWSGLTGGDSVHLTNWPNPADFPADPALVAAMDDVRQVCSTALALRKAAGKRVRLPLAGVQVISPRALHLEPYADIIRDELNVKSVTLSPFSPELVGSLGVTRRLNVLAKVAGPRLGKDVQRIIQAAKRGDWSLDTQSVVVDGIRLEPGEYELVYEAGERGSELSIAVITSDTLILLDTQTTAELEAEGHARDIIRAIQDARKEAGFDVSDRITTQVKISAGLGEVLETYRELICQETLTTILEHDVSEPGPRAQNLAGGGAVEITVLRQ